MSLFRKSKPVVEKKFLDPKKDLGKEFEVDNWILSEFIVTKLVPVVGVRPFPVSELLLMSSAVTYFKPDAIFEWGTHVGKSARIWYEITKAFNVNTDIHSIDLPDDVDHVEHPENNRGMMVKGLERVSLHQGDGIDDSMRLLKENNYKNPLFYVDGDHSYESVKRELSAIMKNTPSVPILLHDTFYQTEESNYNVGPNLAIKECLDTIENNYQVKSTQTGLPGMTLLY